MKKKKMIIFIAVFLVIVIGGVVLKFVMDLNKEKKEMNVAISKINDSYDDLSNNINSYNKYRDQVNDSLSSYYMESFKEDYSTIIDIFKKYDNVIEKINNNINVINKNCGDRLFIDNNVNDICSNYKEMYEEVINIYVNDINNFNKIVNTYNQEAKDDFSLFKSSVVESYIDYNKDSKYKGRD